jgi:hypothetical protein
MAIRALVWKRARLRTFGASVAAELYLALSIKIIELGLDASNHWQGPHRSTFCRVGWPQLRPPIGHLYPTFARIR